MINKCVRQILVPVCVCIFSCQNEDTQKVIPKDSTAIGHGAGNLNDSAMATNTPISGPEKKLQSSKDSSIHMLPQTGADNLKTKKTKAAKKALVINDSAGTSANTNLPAARKVNPSATDNTKATVGDNSISAKPFISKYGTIPRNATKDNITEFVIAFPDKTTLIKIYFDTDPDSEMQGVKAQIVKVLKQSGYTNINEQSQTLHPMHVPKEIHYELQHDGSVVIWIPPINSE
jgi:hypothetical protein